MNSLSKVLCLLGIVALATPSLAQFNYADALRVSVEWFDANRCGPDAGNNNIFSSWRGACHTTDGSNVGVDLTGGFHDAGDHVKFGLPQAFSAATMGWALYEYRDTFDDNNITPKLLSTLKYLTDYFLRSHPNANTFYYHVGNGDADHAYWGPPEDQTTSRADVFAATPANPTPDVCGLTAAALALMSLNYQSTSAAYAQQCLNAAIEIYNIGLLGEDCNNQSCRSQDTGSFYDSSSHLDDLAWGAVWLAIATGDNSYLDPVDAWLDIPNDSGDNHYQKRWSPAWDDQYLFVFVKMYELTGVSKYYDGVVWNLEWYRDDLQRTPAGLPWLFQWGVLRHASAEAGLGYLMAKKFGYTGYMETADLTMDYILGDNERNGSYITNYLSNPPVHPHHRANQPGAQMGNNTTNGMYGALVGGPDAGGNWNDDINNFQTNEVAIDYNASYILGVVGRVFFENGSPNPPPNVTITSPSNGATFSNGDNVSIQATASDPNGSVAQVDFLQNGNLIATDTSAPYSAAWTNVSTGTYQLTARARDNEGAIGISEPVNVSVAPSSGVPVPGHIEAEDFVAMQGIQTETTTDDGGGLNVGYLDVGDWLEYYIDVAESGAYILDYRFANEQTGEIEFTVGGIVLATTTIPNTGGWQNWTTVTTTVNLPAGVQILRLNVTGAPGNINWFELRLQGGPNPPAAPSNLSASAISESQINLNWNDNSDNEDEFQLQRSPNGSSGWTQLAVLAANTTSYADGGLAASTTYFYRVRASNSVGNSGYSNTASATTEGGGDGQAPYSGSPAAIPGTIQAEEFDIGGQSVAYNDTDSGNNGGAFRPGENVDIENTTDSGGGFNVGWIATNEWLEYTVDVAASGNYDIDVRVASQSTGGNFHIEFDGINVTNTQSFSATGGWQNWITHTISSVSLSAGEQVMRLFCESPTWNVNYIAISPAGSSNPPNAPSNLTAAAVSSSQINLTWQDNSNNETGFRVERSTGGGFTTVATLSAGSSSYSNTGLAASTTYSYRVAAFNGDGDSPFSNTASATTQDEMGNPPDPPSNLTAAAVSSSQINLTWQDNSNNETGFRVERSTGGGFTTVATLSAGSSSYSNTGLAASTTYSYRVAAFNGDGDSPFSNTASATTQDEMGNPPDPPSNLTAAAVSSSQINLTWQDNSNNETGFRVERSTGGGFTTVATLSAGSSSYSNTGLAASTTYSYRVAAFNGDGDSPFSNTASATTDGLGGDVTATFTNVNDWGAGFQGMVTITNNGSSTLSNWFVQMTMPASISNIWNGTIVSNNQPNYVIQNAGYNANIAPGSSVSFGFLASPGGVSATNLSVTSGAPKSNGPSEITIPTDFALYQNYPNPFNPGTVISYAIPESAPVRLSVYNIRGQHLQTLVNEIKPAGEHQVRFEATGLAGGIYIYRIDAGDYHAMKKMLLTK